MLRTIRWIPRPAVEGVVPRWGAWLRRVWDERGVDDDERLLREARDLADLERRLRRQERGRPERFGPLPPTP